MGRNLRLSRRLVALGTFEPSREEDCAFLSWRSIIFFPPRRGGIWTVYAVERNALVKNWC